MKRSAIQVLLVAVGLSVAGCHEPTDVVPVYPLGMEPSRMPNIPAGEGAQALGEQPAVSASQNKVAGGGEATAPPTPIGQPKTTPDGLIYETLVEGTGEQCVSGQNVKVHYTGTLVDGTKFDSSRDPGKQPFVVESIGAGRVVQGWNKGIPGMKIGERRKLTIPPSLGYGAAGNPPVPGNATMLFDVELLGIVK